MRDRLLSNVFTKAVRDWLTWTIIAIVALWLIGAMYFAVMSSSGDAYVTMLEDFPEALANIYGQQDGTAIGMALSGMYSLMAPLVLLAYAIGLGSSAAVGEEESRTLPVLLSSPLRRRSIDALQVNLGYRCNQSCLHCHVNAGPTRTESMSAETIAQVLDFLAASGAGTLDLTGGAPELNPGFRGLVERARARGVRVIDRCNLTILEEPGQETLGDFLAAVARAKLCRRR